MTYKPLLNELCAAARGETVMLAGDPDRDQGVIQKKSRNLVSAMINGNPESAHNLMPADRVSPVSSPAINYPVGV